MALILRAGVTESGGELVELQTGVVLDAKEAYEAVEWRANSEPLGTHVSSKLRELFRAQSRFPMLKLRDLAAVRARRRAKVPF